MLLIILKLNYEINWKRINEYNIKACNCNKCEECKKNKLKQNKEDAAEIISEVLEDIYKPLWNNQIFVNALNEYNKIINLNLLKTKKRKRW